MKPVKFVLAVNSSTQRITAKITETSVLLNKEYRKSSTDDWKVGKGITVSQESLLFLAELLKTGSDELLAGYEVLKEEEHGNTTKNSHYRS